MLPQEKKSSFLIFYLILFLAVGAVFYFLTREPKENLPEPPKPQTGESAAKEAMDKKKNLFEGRTEPLVVKEDLKVPNTKNVVVSSGRTVDLNPEKVQTPLVPQTEGEKVIVTLATYKVKGAYELALKDAQKWSKGAKLAFVKSLGAVTIDGKSSQWQVVFVSSQFAKKSYEVIVQGDAVVSKKEVEGAPPSADLPKTWFDSDEAVKRLAAFPHFANALISGINFFYNADGKEWLYAFATSLGTTSLELE